MLNVNIIPVFCCKGKQCIEKKYWKEPIETQLNEIENKSIYHKTSIVYLLQFMQIHVALKQDSAHALW